MVSLFANTTATVQVENNDWFIAVVAVMLAVVVVWLNNRNW